jgi:hypothetical protein
MRPKPPPPPVHPLERFAVRICQSTNTTGLADAGPAIRSSKLRGRGVSVDEAVAVAVEKGWLRRSGGTYLVTDAGAKLGGRPMSRLKTRRVLPF